MFLILLVLLSLFYPCFFRSVLLILLALFLSLSLIPFFFWWVGVANLVSSLCLLSRVFCLGRCCSSRLPSISYPEFFGGSVLLISFSLYLLSRVFWRSVLLISFAFYLLSRVFCWVRVAHLVCPLSLIPVFLLGPCCSSRLPSLSLLSRVFRWVGVAHLVCPLSLIPVFLVGPCCSSSLPSISYPGFFAGSVLLISFALALSYPGFFVGSVLLISFALSLLSRIFCWVGVAHLVCPLSLIPGFLLGPCCSSRLPSLSYPVFFGGSVLLISFALSLLSRVFCWVGVAHLVCPLSLIPGFLVGRCCSSRLPSLSYPGFLVGRCCSSRLPSLSYPGFFGGSVLFISFAFYLLSRVFWWVGVAHLVCPLSLIPGFFGGSVLLISFALSLLSRVFWWVRVSHLVCPFSLIPGFLVGRCCSSRLPSLSYPGFFVGSVLLISFALYLLSRVFWWVI